MPIRTAIPRWAFQVFRASGANVLATVNAVKAELEKINEGAAKEQGVTLQYSFDPSHFINQAMGMVTSDLILGILLAVGVLVVLHARMARHADHFVPRSRSACSRS